MGTVTLRAEELACVTVVPSPSMAVETALSLMVLRRPHTRFHAAWGTHTLSSLQALPGAAETAQLQALIRLAETATAAEMVTMVGDPLSTMAGRLAGVLHSYQQVGLRSIWHRLQEALDAERLLHSRALLNGGPRELLGAIGRGLAWDGAELRVGANPERHRAPRRPRVVLMPSAFCRVSGTNVLAANVSGNSATKATPVTPSGVCTTLPSRTPTQIMAKAKATSTR